MVQDWINLTFIHWRVNPSSVQSLLPAGLEVDVYDESAWVGLVPFHMRIQVGPVPALPYATIFPETNVRTYVHGPDGRAGIWFFSLDVPRLAAVIGARAAYGLPYMWSRMSIEQESRRIRYRCRRRWPAQTAVESDITIGIDRDISPADTTDLEFFLTCRWRLYARIASNLVTAPVEHRPWPLARARIINLADTLVRAAGLSQLDDPPLVHYSPGVRARIGLPRPMSH